MSIVEFCEKVLGLTLYDYQKTFIERVAAGERPICITIPRHLGHTNYKKLVEEYETNQPRGFNDCSTSYSEQR